MSQYITENQTLCTPPNNIAYLMVDYLDKYPASHPVSQAIAMALLRVNKFPQSSLQIHKIQSSIESMILDISTGLRFKIEIIFRLSQLSNQQGINILKHIINSSSDAFPVEYKNLAFTLLLKSQSVDVSQDEHFVLQNLLIINNNFSHALSLAKKLGNDYLQNTDTLKIFKSLFTDDYIKFNGHNVHKLKAKDTTDRWAYYFVLVEPENEHSFMNAIKGDGIIDIEHFGNVIASCYGEGPSDEIKEYLKLKYNFDV
jgi:hypothetical protein